MLLMKLLASVCAQWQTIKSSAKVTVHTYHEEANGTFHHGANCAFEALPCSRGKVIARLDPAHGYGSLGIYIAFQHCYPKGHDLALLG